MEQSKLSSKRAKMGTTSWSMKVEDVNKLGSFDCKFLHLVQRPQDKEARAARIIEVAELAEAAGPRTPESYKYYVHFLKFNRRNDIWVAGRWMRPTTTAVAGLRKEDIEPSDREDGIEHINHDDHEKATKVKKIAEIMLGPHVIHTWYYSPFPEDYQLERLFFCEACLAFFKSFAALERHTFRCEALCPPGDQVYKDDSLPRAMTLFEVDGAKHWLYCENLAYISKLFLDHKLLEQRMDPFVFYVLFEYDALGFHLVGYFSRSKLRLGKDSVYNNLSCILVLPPYLKRGYGKLLMGLSYELCLIEEKAGTPERPISDLGLKSFTAFWTQRIVKHFAGLGEAQAAEVSVATISAATGIAENDVIRTLEESGLMVRQGERWCLCLDPRMLKRVYAATGHPAIPVFPENIVWAPLKVKG